MNSKVILLILSMIFIDILGLNAQNKAGFVKTKNANESLKIAESLINDEQFEKAKKQILHTIKIKDNFAVAYRVLGKINLELALYQEAVDAFEKSFEMDDKLSRAAFFECSKAYLRLFKVELADFHLTKYEQMKDMIFASVVDWQHHFRIHYFRKISLSQVATFLVFYF